MSPPLMDAKAFIEEFRRSSLTTALTQELMFKKAALDPSDIYLGSTFDENGDNRFLILSELEKDLSPSDRPLLRYILEQEITYHQNIWCILETIGLCGLLLFRIGCVEDVPLLWQAKRANFDTESAFDIQYLVGAGVEETLKYLQDIPEPWARDATKYIEACRASGSFDHLEDYRKA